jgi:hypothetical protein
LFPSLAPFIGTNHFHPPFVEAMGIDEVLMFNFIADVSIGLELHLFDLLLATTVGLERMGLEINEDDRVR